MGSFLSQDSSDSEPNYTAFTEQKRLPPIPKSDLSKYVGMKYEDANVQFRAEYGSKGYHLVKRDNRSYYREDFCLNGVRVLVADDIIIAATNG